MSANDRQVAGNHYGARPDYQHWDMVIDQDLNYFEGQITKYVMRCRKKHGLEDLEKAKHFLEKYIENYHRMDRLPAEVVRVLPRKQSEVDDEWEGQNIAAKLFHEDGFVKGGNRYQCIKCRLVVTAGSPLGAAKIHACALAPTPGVWPFPDAP